MSYLAKLKEMGYELQKIDLDGGRLMHAVRSGDHVYVSGQVSRWGEEEIQGKVGQDLTTEQGYRAAQLCALNILQAVHTIAGLDNVRQVVKVFGMVNVGPGFDDTPSVIHGCSELFIELFGDAGRHARSAIGLTVPAGGRDRSHHRCGLTPRPLRGCWIAAPAVAASSHPLAVDNEEKQKGIPPISAGFLIFVPRRGVEPLSPP